MSWRNWRVTKIRPSLPGKGARALGAGEPTRTTAPRNKGLRYPADPPRVELAREGVPLNVIQRQLGHSNLGVTSTYLQGIDHAEVSTRSTRAGRR